MDKIFQVKKAHHVTLILLATSEAVAHPQKVTTNCIQTKTNTPKSLNYVVILLVGP